MNLEDINFTGFTAPYTTREVADAIVTMAPAMDAAWKACLNDDALWAERAKRHGLIRTWLLRWQLRRGK